MGTTVCGTGDNSDNVEINLLKRELLAYKKKFGPLYDIPGFKGKIVGSHNPDYESSRYQYATTSKSKESMSPHLILYPQNDDDIRRALKYARKIKKHIVVRSGGHQYSGLSSGNDDIVVIDLSAKPYQTCELIKEPNIVRVGAAKELGQFGKWLNKRNIAMPFGVCGGVHIGGHIQTGGYGNIIRSFGISLDYCISFDIILSDGRKRTVTKPTTQEIDEKRNEYPDPSTSKNNALYWAVLGGSPGSYGIITHYTFECIIDANHPNSGGFQCYWLYTKPVMKAILKEFENIAKLAKNGELPPDIDIMITVGSPNDALIPFYGIIVEGVYGNVKGENEEYIGKYFESIKKAAGKAAGLPLPMGFKNGKYPISDIMARFTKNFTREYDLPFVRSLRGTNKIFEDGWIDSYLEQVDKCDWISEDLHKLGKFDGLKLLSQIQIAGGYYRDKDRNSLITSISNRNVTMAVSFDIFYYPGSDGDEDDGEDPKDRAIRILNENKKAWVDDELFSDKKEDIRFTWGTFGDTNIDNVWHHYFDNNKQKYNQLIKIKLYFDKDNLFSCPFAIPTKMV